MAVRRLFLSDLHLGSGDDLLRHPACLERIEPELAWCDELVINGDLLELVFSSLGEAVSASRPFFALVDRHVPSVVYVPGNHDWHLVSMAADELRMAAALGQPAPQAFRVGPAERLIAHLAPNVRVLAPYPVCELDGLRIIHGHYLAAHLESFGWRMMDRLSWGLTGQPRRSQGLGVNDYEALIAPLYDFMYAMANLPAGRQAQQTFERWLAAAGAVAQAPTKAGRQAVGVARGLLRAARRQDAVEVVDAPVSALLDAMQAVCRNLDIAPGPVVFAHTHTPLLDAQGDDPRWTFHNPGSWIYDRRMREHPAYRQTAWPGSVLRATGPHVELRHLLDDLAPADLDAMVGAVSDPKRRRRLRSRPDARTGPGLTAPLRSAQA